MQFQLKTSSTPRVNPRPLWAVSLTVLFTIPLFAVVPTPILKFQMTEGTGSTVANSGSAGGVATKSAGAPTWSANTPVIGGTYSLDFGTSLSPNYFVDMLTPTAMKGLKSFTITGWLNCKDLTTGGGGNRILVNVLPGGTVPDVAKGIDLAYRSDGSLSLGVNQWNDWGGVHSHGGKITTDPNGTYNNWRFFAVTYNSTLGAGQVKFYFGSNVSNAELDVSRDYGSGPVGTHSIAYNKLALGNMNADNRYPGTNEMFRGLMDQIQLFGSTTDGSGALSSGDVISVQGATPLAGNGVLYEEFSGITGTAISDLTSNPAYPNSPTSTIVRPSFDGFQFGTGKENFGVKMSGWIKAPTTGSYTFWISSDDNGELRLSTDANPANKKTIASVPGWVNYNEWEHVFTTGQPSPQKSSAISLVAGQYYYIEALMKEGSGVDHLTVQWQIPGASAPESPIPGSRIFMSPPLDGNFPSAYPMYEPATMVKKATMGWKKDVGNNNFYIESEGTKAMGIQYGTAIFPDKLFFGGRFPNDVNENDLGFRWDRPSEGAIGNLYLETQGGHWAMRTEAWSEMEPHVDFNQLFDVTGPDAGDGNGNIWSGTVSTDYLRGSLFDRTLQGLPNGQYYREYSLQNGNGLTVTSETTINGITSTESTKVTGGQILVAGKDLGNRTSTTSVDGRGFRYVSFDENNAVATETVIDGAGITSDWVYAKKFVTTPKWKVIADIPDYVFEDGYKLRSLQETERYVKAKKHLPEMPTAKEMSAKGMDLTEMNIKLLKKVEELTLHMIAMDKELKDLKAGQGERNRLGRDTRLQSGTGKGN